MTTEYREVGGVPGNIDAHAGSRDEPFTLYEGEDVVTAVQANRYIAAWDPVDLTENR